MYSTSDATKDFVRKSNTHVSYFADSAAAALLYVQQFFTYIKTSFISFGFIVLPSHFSIHGISSSILAPVCSFF